MNFQQLRYVRAAMLNKLNLTEVANTLFTSQSGVSKQIKELEAELRFDIFVRRGKRLVGLTQAGETAVAVIEGLLKEADSLKRLSDQFAMQNDGRLVLAATHNQANYVLPPILARFSRKFPDVQVELRQGTPKYVGEMLLSGEADLGVATEALDTIANLETIPCFAWEHVAIVPLNHPLATLPVVTLADIASYPIITYSHEVSGGANIAAAFDRLALEPEIRLIAMDADVIKTYVRFGMGVGIVSEMAIANGHGPGLVALKNSNSLFETSTTKVAFLKGVLQRNFAYELVAMLASHVDPATLTHMTRMPAIARSPKILPFSQRHDLHFDAGDINERIA